MVSSTSFTFVTINAVWKHVEVNWMLLEVARCTSILRLSEGISILHWHDILLSEMDVSIICLGSHVLVLTLRVETVVVRGSSQNIAPVSSWEVEVSFILVKGV